MKKSQIQVGMNVVVNDAPDATVYQVDCLEGFEAHLIYNTRIGADSAGWVDVSRIYKEIKQTEHN